MTFNCIKSENCTEKYTVIFHHKGGNCYVLCYVGFAVSLKPCYKFIDVLSQGKYITGTASGKRIQKHLWQHSHMTSPTPQSAAKYNSSSSLTRLQTSFGMVPVKEFS